MPDKDYEDETEFNENDNSGDESVGFFKKNRRLLITGLAAVILMAGSALAAGFYVKDKAEEAHKKSKKNFEWHIKNANNTIAKLSGKINALTKQSEARRLLIENLLRYILKVDPKVNHIATNYFKIEKQRAAVQDSVNLYGWSDGTATFPYTPADSLPLSDALNQRAKLEKQLASYDATLNVLFRGYASPQNKELLSSLAENNTLILPDSVWSMSISVDSTNYQSVIDSLAIELKNSLLENENLKKELLDCESDKKATKESLEAKNLENEDLKKQLSDCESDKKATKESLESKNKDLEEKLKECEESKKPDNKKDNNKKKDDDKKNNSKKDNKTIQDTIPAQPAPVGWTVVPGKVIDTKETTKIKVITDQYGNVIETIKTYNKDQKIY